MEPANRNILSLAALGGLLAVVVAAAAPGVDETNPIDLDEAELFLEQNATDGDLGLHFKADGEAWRRFVILNPHNRRMVAVEVRGHLGETIGLTELFSESAEPSFDEVPPEEFLGYFEEGTYRFFGTTTGGELLRGTALLTHDLPGEVELLTPMEDEEVDPDSDLVLSWLPLADPAPPASVIEFYEVVVEKDVDDTLARVFSVIMLPGDTSVRVPAEFLEPGTDYKVEVIAEETSGNRTAIEVPFGTL